MSYFSRMNAKKTQMDSAEQLFWRIPKYWQENTYDWSFFSKIAACTLGI